MKLHVERFRTSPRTSLPGQPHSQSWCSTAQVCSFHLSFPPSKCPAAMPLTTTHRKHSLPNQLGVMHTAQWRQYAFLPKESTPKHVYWYPLRTYLTKILYLHLNILKKMIYANYLMISGARLWGGLGQQGNWSCTEPAKAYPPTREHWNKGEQTVPDTQQPPSASHSSSTGCWSVYYMLHAPAHVKPVSTPGTCVWLWLYNQHCLFLWADFKGSLQMTHLTVWKWGRWTPFLSRGSWKAAVCRKMFPKMWLGSKQMPRTEDMQLDVD